MKIAVYGDCHLTKNMRTLQYVWDITSMKSIHHMYNHFDEENVEMAVCLGDFFDAPRLEAKHMNLVMPILDDMNNRTYPTYILLGNHEADDSESNILEFIKSYENIHPVTSVYCIEDLCFIPYYEDPSTVDMNDKIVFTHHDIYGSELASGKTKAFFGLDTSIFKDARLVMNGHVHLKSKVSDNILNAGSLLTSQQGELKLGEYPSYYILDTRTGEYSTHDNQHSMIYLTVDYEDSSEMKKIDQYDKSHLVLKVEYTGEIPDTLINTAHTSWKKKIESIGESGEIVHHDTNFDLKNYLSKFIQSDESVPEDRRESYINTAMELLS